TVLPLEQQSHLGDRLDVGCQCRVGSPGTEWGPGDAHACSGQPEKGGPIDSELSALDPAGPAPAVAQPASGSVASADQPSKLVDADRVLLADQAQYRSVALGQLDATGVDSPFLQPARDLL